MRITINEAMMVDDTFTKKKNFKLISRGNILVSKALGTDFYVDTVRKLMGLGLTIEMIDGITHDINRGPRITHKIVQINDNFSIDITLPLYKIIKNIAKFIDEMNLQGLVNIDDYVIEYEDKADNMDDVELDEEVFHNEIDDANNIQTAAPIFGENRIVYGIPGCGKSHHVNKILYGFNKIIRTTFHPEYSNSDFIGQLRPIKDDAGIDYKIIPGPFSLALKEALLNPNDKIALVIEEINRGNASAIFGDVFQLLDRNETTRESEYSINNLIIEDYLEQKDGIKIPSDSKKNIKIPRNLYIYATMNTSDQNVYKLDTAFKRRWNFTRLTNKKAEKNKLHFEIKDSCIKDWLSFVDSINTIILKNKEELNGDRQIGYWFVKEGIDAEEFADKVLEYLYNDVLKYVDKSIIFKSDYNEKSFDDIYDDFIDGKSVFGTDVKLGDDSSNLEETSNNHEDGE